MSRVGLPATVSLADGSVELRRATGAHLPVLVALLVAAVAGDTVVGTLQLSFLPGLSRRGALRAQIEGGRADARRFYARLGFEATHEGLKLQLPASS